MARIQQVAQAFTAANQVSPWLKHDYYGEPFNVSLAVYFDSALSATLAVQYILDDLSQAARRQAQLSQSGNTITVKDNGPMLLGGPFGHGLLTGDYVNIQTGAPGSVGAVAGEYTATVVDQNTYTLVSPVSQTIAGEIVEVVSGRVLTHPVLTGLNARASSNYGYPVFASRLIDTAFTSAGTAWLVTMQGDR